MKKGIEERLVKPASKESLDVDTFDEPFNRAVSSIAVLHELALARAEIREEFGEDESALWWGIVDLTKRAGVDLKTMNAQFTQAANYIWKLEHPVKALTAKEDAEVQADLNSIVAAERAKQARARRKRGVR